MIKSKYKNRILLGCVSVLILGAAAIDDVRAQEGEATTEQPNIPKAPSDIAGQTLFCKEICSENPEQYVLSTIIGLPDGKERAWHVLNGGITSGKKVMREWVRRCKEVPCPVMPNFLSAPGARYYLNSNAKEKVKEGVVDTTVLQEQLQGE